MAKHFHRTITDTSFTYHPRHRRHRHRSRPRRHLRATHLRSDHRPRHRRRHRHLQEPRPRRTRLPAPSKPIDLDLRPIYHRLDDRVRAHVLICMLAAYLVWHLRKAWAPLTFTDEQPPQRDNPVAAAQRSPHAAAKASTHHDPDGNPLRSFGGLLTHLATLTRNQIRFTGTQHPVTMLTEATNTQRHAFELLNAPIPLTLT